MPGPTSHTPPPPPPQPPGPYGGPSAPSPPGWSQAGGVWPQAHPPQPPKKSSNGLVIALVIVAVILALGLLGVAAMSGESSASREDEAIAELSERIGDAEDEDRAIEQLADELESDELIGLSGFESRCIATRLVEGLGVSRSLAITESELDAGLPQAEADRVADAYVDCIDLRSFFARSLAADPITADLPDFYVDCLFDELGIETFRTQFAVAFSEEGASDEQLEQLGAEAGDRCIASFTPEQLDELAGS